MRTYCALLRLIVLGSTFSLTAISAAIAQESGVPLHKAQGERLSVAIGHYSRARSLLIAAINEFDRGLEKVNPDTLLDSTAWRASLMERAKDLERVLDPQPRASKGGARYEPDRRLLTEAGKK